MSFHVSTARINENMDDAVMEGDNIEFDDGGSDDDIDDVSLLMFCLFVPFLSSADNLCKQFGPRSGLRIQNVRH